LYKIFIDEKKIIFAQKLTGIIRPKKTLVKKVWPKKKLVEKIWPNKNRSKKFGRKKFWPNIDLIHGKASRKKLKKKEMTLFFFNLVQTSVRLCVSGPQQFLGKIVLILNLRDV